MAGDEVNNKVFRTRLGVITQTNHWVESGQVIAYEPYVREMRIWADLFHEVEIFTPLTTLPQKGSLCTYDRSNILFRFVRYNTHIFRWGFLVRFFQLPVVFFKMTAFIGRHDFLLIRSPGHFSFLAHIMVVLLRKKSITKFAGYFGYFKGERIPSVAERFFMRYFLSRRNLVLMYGKSFKSNFISYFPLLLSGREMKLFETMEVVRPTNDVFRFYSLGRLTKVKGYDLAILGLGELYRQQPDIQWYYHLIGDGPELEKLKTLAADLGILNRIKFEGKQPYHVAMQMLKQADALLMPGVMEGWPKVVVEAWVAGAIPVCAHAGLLPEIIRNDENGFLFEPIPEALAEVCRKVIHLNRQEVRQLVTVGRMLAGKLSADSFKHGIRDLLVRQFALD